MREGMSRGIETPPPGKSSERPWSKRREPDIRNVEAEGSSPFTSTKGPGQRPKVGAPRNFVLSDVTLRDLIGEESARVESADERYVIRCRGRSCDSDTGVGNGCESPSGRIGRRGGGIVQRSAIGEARRPT